jgi:RNA polymerase sigma factor (sigma-70 family)
MELRDLPIRELLQKCLDSDGQDEWTEFVRRTQRTISITIKRAGSYKIDEGTVDDLTQDTFAKLFRDDRAALRRIRGEHENSIFAYIRRAAWTTAIDRRPDILDFDELTEDIATANWNSAFDNLRKEEVDRCLKNLPSLSERDREIFWLHFEQGYTHKEISQIPHFNLKESGVESVILRLVRYVKGSLGGSEGKPDG